MSRKVIHFGCVVCNEDNAFSQLICCGGCDLEFHPYCLNPPQRFEPNPGWRCPNCVLSPPANNLKVEPVEENNMPQQAVEEAAAVNLLALLADESAVERAHQLVSKPGKPVPQTPQN